MYENVTFESILSSMLERVPESMDKREGSVLYDAFAPSAIELQYVYIAIKYALLQVFAETSDRQYLILKAKEVGINILPAKKTIIKGEFKDKNSNLIDVKIGERFSIDELNYKVIEKIEDGIYKLECEDSGEKSNPIIPADMIPIEYISNMGSARAIEVIENGEDEESTEHLRERYFIKVRQPATSGNIYHYRLWAMSVNGVGGVKVFPLWNGNGTVKLVIVNTKMEAADEALINEVVKYIEKVRPIGATVTVVSARNKDINISVRVNTTKNASMEKIKSDFILKIKEFFKSTVFKDSYVSLAKIGNILLDIEGVLDYSELKLNSTVSNVELEADEIPRLNSVEVIS